MGKALLREEMPLILISFVLLGLGSALFQSPINTEIMTGLPKARLGTASSVSSTARNFGMALGVSISTLLLTLQLSRAGYYGSALDANSQLLAIAVSNVMNIAAVLCILGTIAAVLRNDDGNIWHKIRGIARKQSSSLP
jgi:MFS family permease